ncbi:HesA/MoeB/ThiF family protein [Riemerella columbina]|uniref:HesA/MoeB/ThiF family protein n=1 Tax=Riemerella columbina TaxID=103810 RepID=UPI000381BA3D|nr:ThiF family adenylyltransferase [Riemerella columbina]
MQRYSRNRLYISQKEQEKIKQTRILIGGCGLGSNIAECILRLGFENMTIVDGDSVELSNLNRQNYLNEDIDKLKVHQLYERLIKINPKANIKVVSEFITRENLEEILEGHSIAVNVLDFNSDIPLLFDKKCREKGIFVIHPYNLGWGGLVTIIKPNGIALDILSRNKENFNELEVVEYVATYSRFWNHPKQWLEDIITKYKEETEPQSPPQLAIASWIVAGMCANVMYNIVTGKPYKTFPEFYFLAL